METGTKYCCQCLNACVTARGEACPRCTIDAEFARLAVPPSMLPSQHLLISRDNLRAFTALMSATEEALE